MKERRRVGRPTNAEIAERMEIERKAWVSRTNFAIYLLQGMLNSNRHILSHFVTKADALWFEECIVYMMERIRERRHSKK